MEAAYWEVIIDEHMLVIGNDDQPTQYWTRNDRQGEFIIAQTLANQPFGKWMISVGNHSTWSDNEVIE
jgi:hypothetical protein